MENCSYFCRVIAPRNLRVMLRMLNDVKTKEEEENIRKYIRYLKNCINSQIN